jgi:hypothetical protein
MERIVGLLQTLRHLFWPFLHATQKDITGVYTVQERSDHSTSAAALYP